jgi:hypothetical protein
MVKDSFRNNLIFSSSLAQILFRLKVKFSVGIESKFEFILDCLIEDIFSTNAFNSSKSLMSSFALFN